MKIFTVHDLASNTYLPPFCQKTDRDAKEGFRTVCNDEKTNYFKYPEDFCLYELGEFDERTCEVTIYEQKFPVLRGSEAQTVENRKKRLGLSNEEINDEIAQQTNDS